MHGQKNPSIMAMQLVLDVIPHHFGHVEWVVAEDILLLGHNASREDHLNVRPCLVIEFALPLRPLGRPQSMLNLKGWGSSITAQVFLAFLVVDLLMSLAVRCKI